MANTIPTNPTQVVVNPASPRNDQDITATASGSTDPDGQNVSYRYKWWCRQWNGVHYMQYEGNPLPASYTTGNQVWYCEAIAFDGVETSASVCNSSSFTIANSWPTTPTAVAISPQNPGSADDITATGSGSTDPDNNGAVISDTITYQYQWLRHEGDIWVLRWETATLPASLTGGGETWYVRCRAADSHGGYSGWFITPDITIANTAPTKPLTVNVKPATPDEDDDLEAYASGSTDADGDNVTYSYQWVRYAGRLMILGPTGKILEASRTLPGQVWAARVKASDGVSESEWKYSSTVTISDVEHAPTPPTEVVVTPAQPLDDDPLACSAAGSTDADGTTPTYKYLWMKSTDGGTTWISSGVTTATLDASATTEGEQWRCQVRGFDGTLTSSAVDSNSVAVLDANTPATQPTTCAITPAQPADGNNLVITAEGSTDPEGATVIYQYQWSKSTDGGATWSAWARGSRVTRAEETTVGEKWKARARAFDGALGSPWKPSNIVTIGTPNRPPTVPTGVVISPSNPIDTDNLVATASGSTDPDGRAITYEYQWCKSTNNGASWSAWRTGANVKPASATAVGDKWRARARAKDGTLVGLWRLSNTVTIAGSRAVSANVSISASQVAGGNVQIALSLTAPAAVQVTITSLAGRTVAVLPAAQLSAGCSSLLWNGRSGGGTKIPAGVYFVRAQSVGSHGSTGSSTSILQLR